MTEQNGSEKHSAADKKVGNVRRLSTKDKFVNAIPLLIALFVVIYFVYACYDNQETAGIHNRFIHAYKASCYAFDESLEEFLRGNLPSDEFQAAVKDIYLPRMKELDITCKALNPETIQSFPCMEEFKALITLKIELAELLLEKPLDITQPRPKEVSELFKKIAALSKTVQEKCNLGNEQTQ